MNSEEFRRVQAIDLTIKLLSHAQRWDEDMFFRLAGEMDAFIKGEGHEPD